ncbi:MAG: hypothetical protein JXR42_01625 [Gammaproteobacteria bacterium]|nr:hypothetical protein [Gammaproteobacteria bacterium]
MSKEKQQGFGGRTTTYRHRDGGFNKGQDFDGAMLGRASEKPSAERGDDWLRDRARDSRVQAGPLGTRYSGVLPQTKLRRDNLRRDSLDPKTISRGQGVYSSGWETADTSEALQFLDGGKGLKGDQSTLRASDFVTIPGLSDTTSETDGRTLGTTEALEYLWQDMPWLLEGASAKQSGAYSDIGGALGDDSGDDTEPNTLDDGSHVGYIEGFSSTSGRSGISQIVPSEGMSFDSIARTLGFDLIAESSITGDGLGGVRVVMPFPVESTQVDVGSGVESEYDAGLRRRAALVGGMAEYNPKTQLRFSFSDMGRQERGNGVEDVNSYRKAAVDAETSRKERIKRLMSMVTNKGNYEATKRAAYDPSISDFSISNKVPAGKLVPLGETSEYDVLSLTDTAELNP